MQPIQSPQDICQHPEWTHVKAELEGFIASSTKTDKAKEVYQRVVVYATTGLNALKRLEPSDQNAVIDKSTVGTVKGALTTAIQGLFSALVMFNQPGVENVETKKLIYRQCLQIYVPVAQINEYLQTAPQARNLKELVQDLPLFRLLDQAEQVAPTPDQAQATKKAEGTSPRKAPPPAAFATVRVVASAITTTTTTTSTSESSSASSSEAAERLMIHSVRPQGKRKVASVPLTYLSKTQAIVTTGVMGPAAAFAVTKVLGVAFFSFSGLTAFLVVGATCAFLASKTKVV